MTDIWYCLSLRGVGTPGDATCYAHYKINQIFKSLVTTSPGSVVVPGSSLTPG